jgi:hypothetical protein
MNPTYNFPDSRAEARRRAEEFQQLSSSERWAELAAMMAFGWEMVASSPQRDAIERRMADQEAAAQHIQRELFQRHGR